MQAKYVRTFCDVLKRTKLCPTQALHKYKLRNQCTLTIIMMLMSLLSMSKNRLHIFYHFSIAHSRSPNKREFFYYQIHSKTNMYFARKMSYGGNKSWLSSFYDTACYVILDSSGPKFDAVKSKLWNSALLTMWSSSRHVIWRWGWSGSLLGRSTVNIYHNLQQMNQSNWRQQNTQMVLVACPSES